MEINLTEQNLKVGKYECQSVTIFEEEGGFEILMFDIKGITERKLLFWDGSNKTTSNTGKPYLNNLTKKQEYKTYKLKKKIKVKKVFFIGLNVPKIVSNQFNVKEGKIYLYAVNTKKNYINFYANKKEVSIPPNPKGIGYP